MTISSPEYTSEITHHSALASGVRIHYRRVGEGPEAVVCLHGFPQTGRAWERLAVRLAERFTVIAPDLRGAGDSQRPEDGYDKKTVAVDIRALVASLGLGRVHLVGHDIGAAVAYAYAAQWPDEVARLVMIEMLLPGFGLEAMYAIRRPGEFAHTPFFMAPDLPEWLVAGREAAFLEWFIRNMVADQAAFGPDDIAAYARAYARPGALRAAFDGYRAFWQDADDNKTFAQTKLKMPVLAIGAELSVGTALAQSLEPLAEDLRGLVFEGCGHFIPDEQPDRLARELEAYLGEGRPDPDRPAAGASP